MDERIWVDVHACIYSLYNIFICIYLSYSHSLVSTLLFRVIPMPATGDVLFTHANITKAQVALGYVKSYVAQI